MSDKHAKPKVLLSAILLAVIIVPMGVSGTGVALPHIAADLGAQPTHLQWVVNAFNLTFAVFSLVAGSIADHLGRKRGLLLGSTIFGIANVFSALAPNLVFLDIARGLAGIGAAIVFSCSGALLAITFSGKAAARAFALFGTSAGVGLGLGPTVSSIAISIAGWTGIFWFSSIAIVISIILTTTSAVKETSVSANHSLDYLGALTFAASLTLIIAGIAQSNTWGWTAPRTISTILLGIVLFSAFIWIEKRAIAPLLDFNLLKSPRLVGLLLVPISGAIGFVTLLTYYPTFLSAVWELSPNALGAVMLIMTAPVIIGPLIAGKLHTNGVSAWIILGSSILLFAIGAALLTMQGLVSNISSLVLPFLIIGLGFGLGVGLVDGQAIGSVPEEKSGMVSGLVSTVRLGSEAIVVAVFAGMLNTKVGSNVKEILPNYLTDTEKEAVAHKVVSGEITSIDLTKFDIDSLKTAFAQGMVPLLWSICLLSIALSVIVTLLLRSSQSNLNSDTEV